MAYQGCSNKSCKCNPCKCEECECNDVEFINKDLAVKGNLFVKEDAFVAGDLHVKGKVIEGSGAAGSETLPPIIDGTITFDVGSPTINGEIGTFFIPRDISQNIINLKLTSAYILANLGKIMHTTLGPATPGQIQEIVIRIESPYMIAPGNPNLAILEFVALQAGLTLTIIFHGTNASNAFVAVQVNTTNPGLQPAVALASF